MESCVAECRARIFFVDPKRAECERDCRKPDPTQQLEDEIARLQRLLKERRNLDQSQLPRAR
jgi:hypothetical protein